MSQLEITPQQQELADKVFDRAEKLTGVEKSLFLERCRKEKFTSIRYAIMVAFIRNDWTFKRIGKVMGGENKGYDHSTICYGQNKYKNMLYEFERTGQRSGIVDLCDSLTIFISNNSPERNSSIQQRNRCLDMTSKGSNLYAIVGCMELRA